MTVSQANTDLRIVCKSPAATQKLAASIGALLSAKFSLHLSGEIGTGKSTFAQGLLHALGVTDEVTSPTFALAHNYQVAGRRLLHLDFYRCEQPTEWLAAGLTEDLDKANLVLIEWPERAVNLPSPDLTVVITDANPAERELQLIPHSANGRSIVNTLQDKQ